MTTLPPARNPRPTRNPRITGFPRDARGFGPRGTAHANDVCEAMLAALDAAPGIERGSRIKLDPPSGMAHHGGFLMLATVTVAGWMEDLTRGTASYRIHDHIHAGKADAQAAHLLGWCLRDQADRHASALRLGVDPATGLDLMRTMVERRTALMHAADGVDVVGLARAARAGEDLSPATHPMRAHGILKVAFRSYEGVDPPVLFTALRLGPADDGNLFAPSLEGRVLTIMDQIPETILLGLSGRRVGDAIDTGNPILDDWRIESAELQEGSFTRAMTRITLESDLIPLSEAASA